MPVKCTGVPGWAESPHGRRWFQIWTPESFAATVNAAGFTIESVETGTKFINIWAIPKNVFFF